MNILILGGNGYLGSRIVKKFLDEGHMLTCTKRRKSDLSRLENVKDKIHFIPASVDAVDAALRYEKPDFILNMACSYEQAGGLYKDIIESNMEFPLHVLDSAAGYGIKKYITMGTGLPSGFNMYSFSKKMLSEFGSFYAEQYHMDFYNMKLEMFYGPDEPEGRFIPDLIDAMLDGREVNVTEGTQHRDIISVDDVVNAVFLVLYSPLKGYHEIPVGTGTAPAVSEIVDFIWENTGKKSKINRGSMQKRRNEPDCVADTLLLKEMGGWNPVYWKDGIHIMINEIKNKKSLKGE